MSVIRLNFGNFEIYYPDEFFDYIDVGDRCWRRNVLVIILRCWWAFWPFWSPTISISSPKRRAPTSKRCHQHTKIVTNCKSPTSQCRQHDCSRILLKSWLIFEYNQLWKSFRILPISLTSCRIFRLKIVILTFAWVNRGWEVFGHSVYKRNKSTIFFIFSAFSWKNWYALRQSWYNFH